ncbi:MAG: hypothetical protein EZS28_000374 [Streblomastix strix]|uniref:HAT C-terminal dimerisation domain-containing protein n=1 Tax=Streblomastix strix TaxID=222440 RepID=A0A5J4XA87_9EUKA|nr:MAG: hypothetical protein EZS28_000374 [Streblomastix strix]
MEKEDNPKCGSDENQRMRDLKNQTGRVILNYEDRQELLSVVKEPILDEIKLKHVVSLERSLWSTIQSINWMQLCQESIAEIVQYVLPNRSKLLYIKISKVKNYMWSNAKTMNQDDVFVIDRESYLLAQHTQSEEKQGLAEVALKLKSIPFSDAACERCFSTIKRLLGDDRNRLGEANLFAELLMQTQLTQQRQNRAKLIKDQ